MAWDMVGHQWAVNLLQKHIRSGQVRHAYLIHGEQGLGKNTLAIQFARALNCGNESMSGLYCGDCRACRLIPEGVYPDIHVLTPEDGSASLKVDQIRDLQHQLALSPFESRWRIALIPDFQLATDEAANALLKTLEEPSENVIVILTALDTASLLPTIVSRCEQIGLRAVSKDALRHALDKYDLPEERAQLIAGIAQGRPGLALRYAENPELMQDREEHIDQLTEMLQSSRGGRFAFVEGQLPRRDDLEKQRKRMLGVLQTWMEVWHDALHVSHRPEFDLVNTDRRQLIVKLAGELGAQKIKDSIHAIQRTEQAIDRFANVRLAMEVLMLDLPTLK